MADRAPLVVVGDALLDRDLTGAAHRLAPDAPVPVVADLHERLRPGGAALAACLAARDGRDVVLVTALGDDTAGELLRELVAPWVTLVPLPLDGQLPEKTRVLAGERVLLRMDRGAGRAAAATPAALAAVRSAGALLVADYGRGSADALRAVLAEQATRVPLVWDPHPRGGPPVPRARLVVPSAAEARRFCAGTPQDGPPTAGHAPLGAAAHQAGTLVRNWQAAAVAVTLGARGALLSYGGSPLLVPTTGEQHGDTCGAGDRFAATAAGRLGDGALLEEAVRAAVRAATRYVAAGGARALGQRAAEPPRTDGARHFSHPGTAAGSTPRTDLAGTLELARDRGGTVVAAGGCFDLLHAGHVDLLQAARRLGDCLVVCVNSDASVCRRKGPGRPINPLADRLRVLRALECVDAVAVFDEDTPERLLTRLRPDLWVKGGDYALAELPEAALLRRWGGQAVLLPYLDGHSSTELAERAAAATTSGLTR